jgi:hypothetical protein
MGLAPARDRAGHGERRRQHAAVRDLGEAARVEPADARARRRAAGAVEVPHPIARRVVDQPERVAADARHVRVEDRERRARRDRGVHGGAARLQRLDPGLRGERVGRDDHAARRHGDRPAGLEIGGDAGHDGAEYRRAARACPCAGSR